MGRLIEDLLVLAHADENAFVRRTDVAVAPFAADLLEGVAATADRRFVLGRLDDVHLAADPDRLAQALRNLLRNAIEHTEPGGLVRLEAREAAGVVAFAVDDDGPGIPPGDRTRIFDRFHRVDASRSRRDGGAGLGLAIVRRSPRPTAATCSREPRRRAGRASASRSAAPAPVPRAPPGRSPPATRIARMTLREVMGPPAAGAPPVEVTDLAYDDRLVGPGTLFFCVPGFTRDGHDFASVAVERGAVALVVQRSLGLGVPEVLVEDVRAAMAPAAARLHGDPTARLKVAGVTGTNGKTTTAYLLRSLLEAGGHRTGLLGTVSSVVGGVEEPTVRTTPEAIDLQRTFAAMLVAGDTHCAMEVSSHALELRRADAVHWAVAIFTNLTQDHLDFHPSMEAYFAAKRRLFERAEGPRIVNADDPYGARLAREFADAITFGLEHGDVRATEVSFGPSGSTFTLDGVAMQAPLPGRFNVANVLAAVAAARAFGVPDAVIAAALPHAARVPGRFEPIDEGQDFAVLVDYAHTPDGLENVLQAARGLTAGRVLVAFGAGGDRDRAKRPLMGAVAARLADVVVITSDNPRSEDPEAIVAEVAAGTRQAGSHARVEVKVDRRAAIERAVAIAAPGDVVVVAGKGHEQGQELAGGRKVPFDDATVAREALRARLVA